MPRNYTLALARGKVDLALGPRQLLLHNPKLQRQRQSRLQEITRHNAQLYQRIKTIQDEPRPSSPLDRSKSMAAVLEKRRRGVTQAIFQENQRIAARLFRIYSQDNSYKKHISRKPRELSAAQKMARAMNFRALKG